MQDFSMQHIPMKFCEYYTSLNVFKAKYDELPAGLKNITADQVELLYYLLFSKYGNSRFANLSIDQANLSLWKTVYSEAKQYFKEKEIHDNICNFNLTTDLDIIVGGTTAIYNTALNDGSAPSTNTTTELGYVNSQNTTKYKRTKLEGLANYLSLIANDPTDRFLGKFKPLFEKLILNGLVFPY